MCESARWAGDREPLSTHDRKVSETIARADRCLCRRIDGALDRLAGDPLAGKALLEPLLGHRSLRSAL